MSKDLSPKLSLISRGKSEGIDKYYFGVENKLYIFFVIIGFACVFIPNNSIFSGLCVSFSEEFSFLDGRVEGLNASSEFLGCRFAIQSVINWIVDALLCIYYLSIFLIYFDEREVSPHSREILSIIGSTLFISIIIYLLYFGDISISDQRYPGGMGLMNSHFILILSAGLNMLAVTVFANWLAFLVKLWMRRG